jgi:hypothetical protein
MCPRIHAMGPIRVPGWWVWIFCLALLTGGACKEGMVDGPEDESRTEEHAGTFDSDEQASDEGSWPDDVGVNADDGGLSGEPDAVSMDESTGPDESAPYVSLIVSEPAYIQNITTHCLQIVQLGRSRGNDDHLFAKDGDSNTDNACSLKPYASGGYNLGSYGSLQDTITYFQNSFGVDSVAAVGGFNTARALDPLCVSTPSNPNPSTCLSYDNFQLIPRGCGSPCCNDGEHPINCEYRKRNPSLALIMLGTGDQHMWQDIEGRFRSIIQETLDRGTIPVLVTKGDKLESTDNSAPEGFINGVIRRLSGEFSIPLLDLDQALNTIPSLINRGFSSDNFHYGCPPDNTLNSCYSNNGCGNLTSPIQYGQNARNLFLLQMLDAMRRLVLIAK